MMVKKVGMRKPAMGPNLDITGQGVKKSVLRILTQCILFGKHLSFYKIANGRISSDLSPACRQTGQAGRPFYFFRSFDSRISQNDLF